MKTKYEIISIYSVADPGFPEGEGHQPLSLGENLIFGKIFAGNCMKMKEIGSGRTSPTQSLDPPMSLIRTKYLFAYYSFNSTKCLVYNILVAIFLKYLKINVTNFVETKGGCLLVN